MQFALIDFPFFSWHTDGFSPSTPSPFLSFFDLTWPKFPAAHAFKGKGFFVPFQ